MTTIRHWSTFFPLLALVLSSLGGVDARATVIPSTNSANTIPSATPTQAQTQGKFQLAQELMGECRAAAESMFIYKQRSTSNPIRTLDLNEQVILAENKVSKDGWIAIKFPINGFVQAQDLKFCPGTGGVRPTQTQSLCRQAAESMFIYKQPSIEPIRALEPNEEVILAGNNVRKNGWIAINSPIPGFVRAKDLKSCQGIQRLSSTQTPSYLCRQVVYDGSGGIAVRSRPNINSSRRGLVSNGVKVTLINRSPQEQFFQDSQGREWARITYPVNGWMSNGFPRNGDQNLVVCSN
ncbi:MAG: SH3 domain-containing protein [Moorea sp. SIO3I7]|uniref:SH3 domain-containing protein n=1 Tax=Moorena sp. SIO3I8 TaxID=2607833 RepID=UPI0013BF5658|nr:SH3 domain-containing protein [Moorena sp. SIO3I8]NEN97117.1 SH3 domain-containing protein [Moorena sp. SIO3I7]NEO04084.1 SH3 domain-containing protein [Moorena sp. SIO3I8]